MKFQSYQNFLSHDLAQKCYEEIMQRDELTQDDDIVKTKNVEYKNFIKYDNPHEKKRTFNRFEKYCTPAIREALDYMNGAFVKNVDEFA